jgi:hypothetical protein
MPHRAVSVGAAAPIARVSVGNATLGKSPVEGIHSPAPAGAPPTLIGGDHRSPLTKTQWPSRPRRLPLAFEERYETTRPSPISSRFVRPMVRESPFEASKSRNSATIW